MGKSDSDVIDPSFVSESNNCCEAKHSCDHVIMKFSKILYQDRREDTLLKLAHFRRHKRKTLKKVPGKPTNYPFHKPEEKNSPGKDVSKKVSNVIDKAVNIAKSAKTKKV